MMVSVQVGAAELWKAVHGDMRSFTSLLNEPHAELETFRAELPELTVSAGTLMDVLHALQSGSISPALAKQWASFVRRGYFEGGHGSIRPLDIIYEPSREDAIVEVIARLDELGDLIDGEISEEELKELLLSLVE
jgi:hypothetical protein